MITSRGNKPLRSAGDSAEQAHTWEVCKLNQYFQQSFETLSPTFFKENRFILICHSFRSTPSSHFKQSFHSLMDNYSVKHYVTMHRSLFLCLKYLSGINWCGQTEKLVSCRLGTTENHGVTSNLLHNLSSITLWSFQCDIWRNAKVI